MASKEHTEGKDLSEEDLIM